MRPIASLPSVSEIVTVAFRHKWALLTALLAPPLLFIGAAYTMQPIYQAETRVLVKPAREFMPRGDGPGASYGSPQTTMREVVDTVMQTVTSADLMKDVLGDIGVAKLYPGIAATASPAAVEDAAVRALRDDLVVWPIRLTNVIEIRLRNPDRGLAVEALRAAVDRFEERHVRAYSNDRSHFLETEIDNNLRLLADVQAERARYIASRGLHSVDEQRSLVVQQRIRAGQELRETEMRADALGSRIAYLKRELAAQPATITLQTTVQDAEAAVAAARRMHELRERAQETQANYGAGHPATQASRAALAAAEQAVRQTGTHTRAVSNGINPLHSTLLTLLANAEAEHAPLAGRIASLKAALDQDDARLQQISTDEVRLRGLNTRVAELESANAALRQRLTDARITEDLDRAKVIGLSVIQAPMALDRAVAPVKILFAAGGVALGLISSGFVLLVALTFGNRFISAETVERILGAPVLVALPAAPELRIGPRIGAPARRIAGTR